MLWHVLISLAEDSHFSCAFTAVEALPELFHVPNSMCPKKKALTRDEYVLEIMVRSTESNLRHSEKDIGIN